MSGSSYQLPDLLSLTRDFDLRTNRHCRSVLEASQHWLLSLNHELKDVILTEDEMKYVPGLKMGLLASLCFPTCDLPQLRLASDFIGLLLISNERVKRGINGFGWSGMSAEDLESLDQAGFVELLESHELFKHLQPRISRLISITTPRWQKQFTSSLLALRDAQARATKYRKNNTLLVLDDYVDFSRDLSGLRAVFDLVESSEGLNLDLTEMRLDDADDLRMLRRVAAEFISLAFDIFSFNNDHLAKSKLNLVEVLMSQRDLSIQGAINQAGHLFKDKFEAFKNLELSLWSRHPRGESDVIPASRNISLGATLSTWIRSPLSRSNSRTNLRALYSASEATKWDTITVNDVSLFLQGLKDCMGGSLNWAYETELFFGSKGEAIRNFGWIFLSSPK
ncbi:hypothetical protein E1B28_004797 [Marasmius oreades]|uniref:Uncharacterized protein n=1 Tax=Marasmius oreades TaxID=181124 RepID=A0A9P8ADC7_9AGAR|nr:uncharacterized protein E1B28_004797 [Marasmius oreades]KAG7097452.1 hypothetical protein E1B28_004797 [Marasmius oreades]